MDKRTNLTIAIGASAGGLQPIRTILENLPSDLQATILVATHRDINAPNLLPAILGRSASISVEEAETGTALECGTLYVGENDETVLVRGNQLVVERQTEFPQKLRRIDELFLSIADSAGSSAIAVILSGMLNDGVKGAKAVFGAGGKVIVQSPHDAKFTSMPESVLAEVHAQYVGEPAEIAAVIASYAQEEPCN